MRGCNREKGDREGDGFIVYSSMNVLTFCKTMLEEGEKDFSGRG